MTHNLIDLIARRLAESSQTLAGCALVHPGAVIRLLARIDLADLQDEKARGFIIALIVHQTELAWLADSQAIEKAFVIAESAGYINECWEWLLLATAQTDSVFEMAEATVREIQGLIVTRRYLTQLQLYAAEVTQLYGRGNRAEREREAALYDRHTGA